MSVECFMVVFDGFYLQDRIYLANYAKISHFIYFLYILYGKWPKITFCLLPTCSIPQRKLKFAGEIFFYHQDDILKFWRQLYLLALNGSTKHVSQTCASDRLAFNNSICAYLCVRTIFLNIRIPFPAPFLRGKVINATYIIMIYLKERNFCEFLFRIFRGN